MPRHDFHHSFATHLLESGYGIRTLQELLDHRDVRTTVAYTYVLNHGPAEVRSSADQLVAGTAPMVPSEDPTMLARYPAERRSLTPRKAALIVEMGKVRGGAACGYAGPATGTW